MAVIWPALGIDKETAADDTMARSDSLIAGAVGARMITLEIERTGKVTVQSTRLATRTFVHSQSLAFLARHIKHSTRCVVVNRGCALRLIAACIGDQLLVICHRRGRSRNGQSVNCRSRNLPFCLSACTIRQHVLARTQTSVE